jgi:hypothetical protein
MLWLDSLVWICFAAIFLTLALAGLLQLCGLLTRYIPRCSGYPYLVVLGLLCRRDWAMVVGVARRMLLILARLLA